MAGSLLEQRFRVYDAKLGEWRSFGVTPPDRTFVPACSTEIHQFAGGAKRCACGKVAVA